MEEKKYSKDKFTVIWKPDLCIHSGICVRGLPAVFDPKRRPWIDLDADEEAQIREQIHRCPSGALSYARIDDPIDKEAVGGVRIRIIPSGPLVVLGDCEIETPEGEVKVLTDRVFLCRCGHSATKPFCDGSHKRVAWQT